MCYRTEMGVSVFRVFSLLRRLLQNLLFDSGGESLLPYLNLPRKRVLKSEELL